jgi:hypothetical protein
MSMICGSDGKIEKPTTESDKIANGSMEEGRETLGEAI